MAAHFRLALGTLGFCLLLLSPFIGHAVWRHLQPPAAPETVDQVRRWIAHHQYDAAYRALIRKEQGDQTLTWRDTMQLALCERVLGRPAEAYARLHALDHPDLPLEDHRLFWMARALDEMGQRQAAIAAYGDFLTAFDTPVLADSVYLRLPQLHVRAGEPRRALALYQEYLKRTSTLAPELLHRIAALYDRIGDKKAARRTRAQLIADHPGHRRVLAALKKAPPPQNAAQAFSRARIYFDLRRYRQAAGALEGYLAAYPKTKRAPEARYLLARAYENTRQYEKAQRLFEHIHKKDKRPSALYRVAGIQVRRNRDSKAIDTYESFAKRYPRHELAPQALWQAAKGAERGDHLQRAQTLFARLADQYPKTSYGEEAAWSTGFMQFCRRSYPEALQTFQGLARRATQVHLVDQSLFWAGKTAAALGLEDEAKIYYHQAAQGFPRSYYAARAVGLGYGAVPDLPPRQTAQWHPVEDFELKGGSLIRRASALAELGLLDRARSQLLRVERLNKNTADAPDRLRSLYERLGIWDRALLLALRHGNGSDEQVWRMYPSYYWDEVAEAAQAAKVDPHLVLSVIRQESLFRHDAVSHAGAMGLMQIMPETGKTLARRLGLDRFERRQLFDPEVSIRLGSEFLGDQVRNFDDDKTAALSLQLGLAAYNAGPHNARKWIKRFPHDDTDAFVERIPYKETRLYVKKVLKNYQIYKAL